MTSNAYYYIFGLFFLLITASQQLNADLTRFVRSIEKISVKSLKQKFLSNEVVLFEGDVEVLIDHKMHVWAHQVLINKKNQTISASGCEESPLLFEHHNTTLLADYLFLDLSTKRGSAQNIRLHFNDGYILASSASKKSDYVWEVENITYTSCEHSPAHWSIHTTKAQLHGGYLLTASGLSFYIGKLPIFWFPYLILPLQGQSLSGFLIPRFFFDYQYGFGFKQQYYQSLGSHSDTTLTFDWREKRGVVLSDEFRWARSLTDYTKMNASFAIVRDMLVQQGDCLCKRTRYRYWIQGLDFAQYELGTYDRLYRLMSVDVGTDKRLGYHFFNNIADIENTFNTAFIHRLFSSKRLWSIDIDSHITRQKVFQDRDINQSMVTDLCCYESCNNQVQQESETQVTVVHLPHCEINSAYLDLSKLCSLRYDFFADFVHYKKHLTERFFYGKTLVSEQEIVKLQKKDVIRAELITSFYKSLNYGGQALSMSVSPHLQMRSHRLKDREPENSRGVYEQAIFGSGVYRLLTTVQVEWGMPEMNYAFEGADLMILPTLTWSYSPSFDQSHWIVADKWDKIYSHNALTGSVLASFVTEHASCDIYLEQGYDFEGPENRFFLQHSGSRHLLPFRCDILLHAGSMLLASNTEYNFKTGDLIGAQIKSSFQCRAIELSVGYLYSSPSVMKRRELLSTLPHFVTLDCSLALSDRLHLYYEAQFYARGKDAFFRIVHLTPVLHRVGLEYKGHCWSAYLGFEEKKYQELGHDKTEQVMLFSVKFDALGSFAKKIKKL